MNQLKCHVGWLCTRGDCEEVLYCKDGSFEYLFFLFDKKIDFDHAWNSRLLNPLFFQQVDPQEKKKKKTGRAKRRIQYNRRFVNVVATFGRKKGPNARS